MKLKKGYILHKTGNDTVLVGLPETNFNGLVKMNSTAAFIAEQLKEDIDQESLEQRVISKYCVDPKTVRDDVEQVIKTLLTIDAIE